MITAVAISSGVTQADNQGDAVAVGEERFKIKCMHCHGEAGDGKGAAIDFLKITPANLTELNGNVTEHVLNAVLGRHALGNKEAKMPLLDAHLSPEDIYFISEFVKSIQK
jgi:mono/diheme cytochrome c family protein